MRMHFLMALRAVRPTHAPTLVIPQATSTQPRLLPCITLTSQSSVLGGTRAPLPRRFAMATASLSRSMDARRQRQLQHLQQQPPPQLRRLPRRQRPPLPPQHLQPRPQALPRQPQLQPPQPRPLPVPLHLLPPQPRARQPAPPQQVPQRQPVQQRQVPPQLQQRQAPAPPLRPSQLQLQPSPPLPQQRQLPQHPPQPQLQPLHSLPRPLRQQLPSPSWCALLHRTPQATTSKRKTLSKKSSRWTSSALTRTLEIPQPSPAQRRTPFTRCRAARRRCSAWRRQP
mmetsp:Transcript_4953/g.8987  ORF Transcript_4953/g.8987 Transcript_4953/m.8987 type:complete len:283 (+) Transcript_4953:56-904(+)